MKVSVWAKSTGISYKTAWRMWPDERSQLAANPSIVHPRAEPVTEATALYARVSSGELRSDRERQLGRLTSFASRERLQVTCSIVEVGSGLHGHKAKILKRLADPEIKITVVEYRDRLARFGSECIAAALAACGRRLIAVDPAETKDDLVQDMLDVLTSFCTRAAKDRAVKALFAAGEA
jgi:predicted site-specific integrase-resolvase